MPVSQSVSLSIRDIERVTLNLPAVPFVFCAVGFFRRATPD